jgi:hypothetical protein
MKVLSMIVSRFAYTLGEKTLEDTEPVNEGAEYKDALLAFVQIEETDEQHDILSREKKLVNHLKWASRKNNCRRVILHSFAHLSASKASVSYTREIFNQAEIRLKNAGFETFQTPFGYFLNLSVDAPGFSLARIWAEL